jgi:prepilin-type N-terminal cleavage/methylation domain-containing protein
MGDNRIMLGPFSQVEGFTLIELIVVIVIVSILSSVAVPKFVNLTSVAYNAKCDANRGAVASAVAMRYADTLVKNPAAVDWLEDLLIGDVKAEWFTTGALPVCPTGGTYTLNRGNVICSIHGS